MPTIPFFKHATLREIIITRLCCAADAVVILCCAIYLVECYHAAGLRWPWLIVALLIGYFLADFFRGWCIGRSTRGSTRGCSAAASR